MVQFVNLHLNSPGEGAGLVTPAIAAPPAEFLIQRLWGRSAEDLQEFPFLVRSQMLLLVRATLRTTAVES